MALLIKNLNTQRTAGPTTGGGLSVLSQLIQVSRPAATITQNTATEMLFRVFGGRVLVHLVIGEVTTIIQSQATTLKLSHKKLDSASAAVGTAVDICATVDGNAKEVGSLYVPLGSGAAAIWSNAGCALGTLGRIPFILPVGELYATAGANSSGALKWDLWYQPLDPGAYVAAQPALTTVI